MNSVVLSKNYPEPPFCEREILRFALCGGWDTDISALLKECIDEVRGELTYAVCYRILPLSITDDTCDLGVLSLHSKKLSVNLRGCEKAVLFAATVGVGIDRLIAKYARICPSKALMMQAIGAERAEALCDTFCKDIVNETGHVCRPRFSPGYGDLTLNVQRDIFAVLDCEKRIGLTLNSSLLMSPSKSVTAIVGLS